MARAQGNPASRGWGRKETPDQRKGNWAMSGGQGRLDRYAGLPRWRIQLEIPPENSYLGMARVLGFETLYIFFNL